MVSRKTKLLALSSFFSDISTGLCYPLLPSLMLSEGLTPADVGLVDGIGRLGLAVSRIFSPALSSILGRKKTVFLGYLIPAIFKPLLSFAHSLPEFAVFWALERSGKGIRDPPRDAIISSAEKFTGSAFGLKEAADRLGAFLGPLLAAFLLSLGFEIRSLFLLAGLPALASAVLVLLLRDGTRDGRISFPGFSALGFLFGLAHPTTAMFLSAFSETEAALGYSLITLVSLVSSLLGGRLSDLFGPGTLLRAYLFLAVLNFFIGLPGISLFNLFFLGISIGLYKVGWRHFLSAGGAETKDFASFSVSSLLGRFVANLLAGWLWIWKAGFFLGLLPSALVSFAALLFLRL